MHRIPLSQFINVGHMYFTDVDPLLQSVVHKEIYTGTIYVDYQGAPNDLFLCMVPRKQTTQPEHPGGPWQVTEYDLPRSADAFTARGVASLQSVTYSDGGTAGVDHVRVWLSDDGPHTHIPIDANDIVGSDALPHLLIMEMAIGVKGAHLHAVSYHVMVESRSYRGVTRTESGDSKPIIAG